MPLMPRSDRRIHVASEVLAELDVKNLNRLYDQREHTEMRCFVCGCVIAPEDDTEAQVVLFRSPDHHFRIINVSHPNCLPSALIDRELPEPDDEWSFDWVAVLRNHAIGAVLIWEMASMLQHGDSLDELEDVFAERLRSEGFRSATDTLDDLVAPVLSKWSLTTRGGKLVLNHPSGIVDEFEDTTVALPAGWLETASESRRVLAVYGSGFGLDRFSMNRVDQALQAGGALCGLIPWMPSAPSRRPR